jgi:Tat protein translocase TatC
MTAPAASPAAPTTPADEDLVRMSFGDHLDELRRRLVRAIGALALAMFVVLPFKNEVTEIYTAPYELMWMEAYATFLDKLDAEVAAAEKAAETLHPLKQQSVAFHREYRQSILDGTFPTDQFQTISSQGSFTLPRTLKALGGLEDFWVFMGAVLLFALILASPVVLYQLWAFVAAGLYRHERRAVLRYFPFAVVMLTIGVLFGYFVVVPAGLYFLIQLMNWARVESMMSVALYFSFLLTLTAALGAVFQLPLVMLALQKVGLVSHEAMRKNWRYVILGMFVLSAMFTPPDPFTQILMAVPMVVLYLLGLFLTGRAARRAASTP